MINKVVVLPDKRLGLITNGQYESGGRVSNYWGGFVLDDFGNVTKEVFGGYNNGQDFKLYRKKYSVITTVKFTSLKQ